MKSDWKPLVAVCALVIAVYVSIAQSGVIELTSSNASDTYYNLLVRAFHAGHLNLPKDVPPGLARLADPYDPTANAPYRYSPYNLYDLSYYKGRLYLYFGVTPALILFWPYAAISGHYLFHRQAVVTFCVLGFLVSLVLLRAIWRRYFAEVSVWVVAACGLALGLATGAPVLLARCDVFEVAISCGYMLTRLALVGIWCALQEPQRRCRWLAAASVAYGLAVGARPSLVFGAVILLVPLAQTWRERQREGLPRSVWLSEWLAATGPIVLIGLGLMLYNALRFENPFEFGMRYGLGSRRAIIGHYFRLPYLWFNLRVYFLEPTRWSLRFPFVRGIAVPHLPDGYGLVEEPFGILTNIPLVWLALAIPWAWQNRSAQAASILRWFVIAAVLLFGLCALPLQFFETTTVRYQVDFMPTLVLLAVMGILALERGLADQPALRGALRCGWIPLLVFSVAFVIFASVVHYAKVDNDVGIILQRSGRMQEAIERYTHALRLNPDYAEAHNNLGGALQQSGKLDEAQKQCEQALRLKPDLVEAHNNLGVVLFQLHRVREAKAHYEEALRLNPGFPETYNNLGTALLALGDVAGAIERFEQALQVNPNVFQSHYNLAGALGQAGRMREAIVHYEKALQLNPNSAEAHNNLGDALLQLGRIDEAFPHLQQALHLKPDFAQAHYNLGCAYAMLDETSKAAEHFEEAVRIKPAYAEAHYFLGLALTEQAQTNRAAECFQRALDLANQQGNTALANTIRARVEAPSHR